MKTPWRLLDEGTIAHCKGVGKIAVQLAKIVGVDKNLIYHAAIWHDTGKSQMLDIVKKEGKLTDDEFVRIKSHPVIGYEIIMKEYEGNDKCEVARIALHHHNRADDTGYPAIKEDEKITTEMQVIQLADVLEALTAKRPYKKAIPIEEAKQMIIDGKCGYFTEKMKNALMMIKIENV